MKIRTNPAEASISPRRKRTERADLPGDRFAHAGPTLVHYKKFANPPSVVSSGCLQRIEWGATGAAVGAALGYATAIAQPALGAAATLATAGASLGAGLGALLPSFEYPDVNPGGQATVRPPRSKKAFTFLMNEELGNALGQYQPLRNEAHAWQELSRDIRKNHFFSSYLVEPELWATSATNPEPEEDEMPDSDEFLSQAWIALQACTGVLQEHSEVRAETFDCGELLQEKRRGAADNFLQQMGHLVFDSDKFAPEVVQRNGLATVLIEGHPALQLESNGAVKLIPLPDWEGPEGSD